MRKKRLLVAGIVIGLLSVAAASKVDWSQIKNAPLTDIRTYGAVCDGTHDSASAVAAAISAGAKTILIPKNCGFTAPGGVIQGGFSTPIKYVGEDWSTSFIQPQGSGTAALQAQAGVILENIDLRHTPNNSTGIDCPIGSYYNLASSTDPVVTTTCYSAWHAYLKDDIYSGIGVSGSNIRNHGIGDGLFVGQYDVGGVGIRSDLESGNGIAMLVDLNCFDSGGCTGGGGIGVVENGVVADGLNNTTPIFWNGNKRTSGNLLAFTHGYASGASTFSGTAINVSMAQSFGTFNGNFMAFANGAATKYQVDSQVNTYIGGGSNVVYRCATAGATLPTGSLTTNAAACGSTADTGLRVK